jgi:peptide/nickel transport system permease protein
MAAFIAKRLAALALLLLVLSLAVFSLLRLAPGSEERLLLGTHPTTPETVAAVRAEYHLDDSFLAQYGHWLSGALKFDFGRSVAASEPVTTLISQRIGITLELAFLGLAGALIGGVALGIVAAMRADTGWDRGIVGLSVAGVSTPVFVSGLALLYLFAIALGWLPAFGTGSGFGDRLLHLVLPAAAMALSVMALIVRITRAAMLTELRSDHFAFAQARGVPPTRALALYAVRGALIPIVTASGLILSFMLTGAVLVETTFSFPGLGSLLVTSVQTKDIPVVQAITLLLAAVIVLVNLAADLLYMVIDPRVRVGRSAA